MKALLTILIIFISLAVYGQVTHREVKIAKAKFKREKWQELRTVDSLYWRGLKAIRHDQHFWIIKR